MPGGLKGSDVIWENPMGNPSVGRTTPDPKRQTSDNSQVRWLLVNECKQKHVEVGHMARIYGKIAGGPNTGRRGSGSRVGHLGRRGPNSK